MTTKAKKLFGLGPALVLALFALAPTTAAALPARFGTEGTGAGQISGEPQGIAVNQENGHVYVADTNNNRIDEFNAEGEFLLAFGWGVADGKSEELQSCTTTCFAGLEGPGAGEFNSPEGIAVDNDPLSLSHGDVYVVDSRNLRVQKFDPEGKFLTMFGGEVNASKANICSAIEASSCQAGSEGPGPGQFEGLGGRSIAVDSSGVVYVGDRNRVQRFSEEGVVEGEVAFSGVGRIQSLAVDSAKDIYLWGGLQEEAEGGVHKYDPSGAELPPPRDPAGSPENLAITIGPGDELLLNDFRSPAHHILAFDPEGKQLASFDRGSQGEDGLRGIAYSEFAKALYVLNKGAVRIVTPPPPGPFVLLASQATSEVEPTSAKLEATVNPEGGEATKCRFEYGTTTGYGESSAEAELIGGAFEDQPISEPITGLQPSTTYHFRAVCENAAKEVGAGPDESFTTLPPVSIIATSVSQVSATSARLEAELNPHGVQSEYRFEYGPTTAYGASVPIPEGSAGSGKADTTVANVIQGLTPATAYHYRVTAHNALGGVTGPDRSFTTQGAASILPDGRSWEMVSPPNKHGSPLEPITEEGGLIQSAAGGGAFAFVALGPVNGEPQGVRSPSDTQLLSRRGAGGWATEDITTPREEISSVAPGSPSEYQFFAEDLSAAIVEPQGETPLSPQTSEKTPYRREVDGEFTPLASAANVPPGTKFGGGVEFAAATPDLSHSVVISPQLLSPGFKAGFEANGEQNVYELSGGSFTLVSVLPSGEAAAEAGLGAGVGLKNLRGVISGMGSRVVFGTDDKALYLRDIGESQTLRIDKPQPGATGPPGAKFQAASEDDSKIFFTDASRLTTDATANAGEPDLYMCEVRESEGRLTCALTDLSVDHDPGEAANVQGVVSAVDASGSHVYFAANGALTSAPNSRGEVAVPGACDSEAEAACNMYVYDTDTHQIGLVAVLSSHDDPDIGLNDEGLNARRGFGNLTARSSPNGRYFTFMSQRSLTGYDNRDASSGEPDEEVFQLDSQSGALSCVSCKATGGRPDGVFDKDAFPGLLVDHPQTWGGQWLAGSIPGWTLRSFESSLYQSRYLSDSGREFFNSSDALVPQDTNNLNDVYEFEPPGVGDCSPSAKTYSSASGGCVSLISSGSSKEESAFLDASESGDEAFFLTSARLVGTDVDEALDVYDAHVCSASSPCPPPPPPPQPACEGDACQNPVAAPNDATPGSLTFHGPGNQTQAPAVKAKAKPLTRAQKLAKALKSCQRRPKSKRAGCRKQARGKYGPVHKAKTKRGK